MTVASNNVNDGIVGSSNQNHHGKEKASTSSIPDSKSKRKTIVEATQLLSARGTAISDDEEPLFPDENDEDHSSLEDDDALAAVQFAATRRRDLDRSHLKGARDVEPVYGKESVHAVPVNEDVSQKDMMWRMMRALNKTEEGEAGGGRAALEKKIKRLHANGKKALAVPLPTPVQGRLDRASAYEDTKETISKSWGALVQKNRKIKRLVFPLNGPGPQTGDNTASIVGKFKPESNYEEEIDSLLREAGVKTDQDVLKREEDGAGSLGSAPVTKEEVLKRRRELARIRSLMFHYEHKMKRIKKIKSKKYRRVLKREKETLAQGMGDSDDEEERARRAEQRRVEERMTLRHKNTSKWVRRQLQRKEGSRNPATKEAIEDQLRMHEELRRRQETEANSSDTSDDEGAKGDRRLDDDVTDDEQTLQHELTNENPGTREGLMGMRFMKEAQERKRKEALALLESMGEEHEEDEIEQLSPSNGRQTFPGRKAKQNRGARTNGTTSEKNVKAKDPKDVTGDQKLHYESPDTAMMGKSRDVGATAGTKRNNRPGFTTVLKGKLSADDNPWISAVDTEDQKQGKTENPETTLESHGNKRKRNGDEGKSMQVTVSRKVTFSTARDSRGKEKRSKKFDASPGKPNIPDGENSTADNAKQGGESKLVNMGDELLRMQDISHAFAGVGGAEQADFDMAKQSEIERNMPSASSLQAEVLPGWGAWDGAGMPKAKRKRAETPFAQAARERLEAARASATNKRSDRKMRHVILNEKRIKQATDLTLSSVPFPFVSREQWEREVDTSVSKELVTSAAFKGAVARRVVAKPGTAIQPIQRGGSADKVLHRGKRGIIDLRKQMSAKRSQARRGLLS